MKNQALPFAIIILRVPCAQPLMELMIFLPINLFLDLLVNSRCHSRCSNWSRSNLICFSDGKAPTIYKRLPNKIPMGNQISIHWWIWLSFSPTCLYLCYRLEVSVYNKSSTISRSWFSGLVQKVLVCIPTWQISPVDICETLQSRAEIPSIQQESNERREYFASPLDRYF